MNPNLAATIAVANLDSAVDRYRAWLDYRVVERGALAGAIAESLAAPSAVAAPMAVLGPASERSVYLRLVEQPRVDAYRSMRSFGWAALEICIEDVHAIHARIIDSPFTIIGPPAAIASLPTIHPMQVEGPDGEVLFLTQIQQGGPGSGLPTARAPVDTLFIIVLACRDLDGAATWVAGQLGASVDPAIEIPYRTINRAFGLPEATHHALVTATRDDQIFIELDRYPAATIERPAARGWLPPGVSVATFLHPDLDAVAGPWLSPPTRRKGAIYEGRRAGVLRMPEGALVELVEAAR